LIRVAEWAARTGTSPCSESRIPPRQAQSKAINSVTGSLAYVGVARFVFCVIQESERPGRHLLLMVKTIGERAEGLGYKIEGCTIGKGIGTSRVVWDDEPVNLTADQAIAAERKAKRAPLQIDKAKEWLRSELGFGELLQTEIEDRAKGQSISGATLRRAFDELGIISEKDRGVKNGRWFWRLPE
jgi:hypothetical protein